MKFAISFAAKGFEKYNVLHFRISAEDPFILVHLSFMLMPIWGIHLGCGCLCGRSIFDIQNGRPYSPRDRTIMWPCGYWCLFYLCPWSKNVTSSCHVRLLPSSPLTYPVPIWPVGGGRIGSPSTKRFQVLPFRVDFRIIKQTSFAHLRLFYVFVPC